MIVLQFASEPRVGSAVIRWFSHGEFSHVDAVLPDGRLLGARIKGGVQIRAPSYLGSDARLRRVYIPQAPAVEAGFYAGLVQQIGKPYDWRAIIAFAAGRDWRADGAWFCSELQAFELERVGCLPRLVLPHSKLTPDDLYLVVTAVYPQIPAAA